MRRAFIVDSDVGVTDRRELTLRVSLFLRRARARTVDVGVSISPTRVVRITSITFLKVKFLTRRAHRGHSGRAAAEWRGETKAPAEVGRQVGTTWTMRKLTVRDMSEVRAHSILGNMRRRAEERGDGDSVECKGRLKTLAAIQGDWRGRGRERKLILFAGFAYTLTSSYL